MADPVYLNVDGVWAVNDLILRAEGQTSLLLNRGALESALLRAQTTAYYQQADLVEQAALLIAGIAFAHAFLDGNKRTAAVAAATWCGTATPSSSRLQPGQISQVLLPS